MTAKQSPDCRGWIWQLFIYFCLYQVVSNVTLLCPGTYGAPCLTEVEALLPVTGLRALALLAVWPGLVPAILKWPRPLLATKPAGVGSEAVISELLTRWYIAIMIDLDTASMTPLPASVSPLLCGFFYDELIKAIDASGLFICSIQYLSLIHI